MSWRWIYIGLTAAAILFLVLPVSSWPLQNWLRLGLNGQPGGEDIAVLQVENYNLRSQLSVLSGVAGLLPAGKDDYLAALIYSRYPFNFKNEILVNAGENSGVKTGTAAAVPGQEGSVSLLGRVESVWPSTAMVRTIFDPRFQLAVRIGDHGADALLTGGAEPRLTLIAKSVSVRAGEIIYSAADNIPYGLPIGTIRGTNLSSDELFQEATLNLPYDLNSLRVIWLKK